MNDTYVLEQPSQADEAQASAQSRARIRRYAEKFAEKSGTVLNPHHEVVDFLTIGLAGHIDDFGRPLCPCNFYEDKAEEVKSSRWVCACEEMQRYKYCHCLLFVTEDGLPITEYLPQGHEGREIYGLVKDPTPDKGRALARLEAKQGRHINK